MAVLGHLTLEYGHPGCPSAPCVNLCPIRRHSRPWRETDAPGFWEAGRLLDVLVDADLFRRLRIRGQACGGPDGIPDLRQALRLVQGRPFTQLRPGGWAWLFGGDRLDQHLVCGIVDVAHLLVTHDLQAGDTQSARLVAETAALAAPHEEIPTLDLAAVAAAEGHHEQAARLLTDEVCNRTDDEDSVPGDLPGRTKDILDRHHWVNKQQAS